MDTRQALVQQNMENFWKLASKTSQITFEKNDQATFVRSSAKDALLNSVLSVNLDSNSAEDVVVDLANYYSKHGKSFCWWVFPDQHSTRLSLALEAYHFESEGVLQGMILSDMHQANLQYSLPEGIEMKQVSFASGLDAWIEPIKVSFALSDEAANSYKLVFKELIQETSVVEHLVAYHEAKPVSSCSIFLDKQSNTAGVYNCGTLPEYRKQGICSALTRQGLFNAKQKGYNTAVLQASPFSRKLFEAEGFEACTPYKLYCK